MALTHLIGVERGYIDPSSLQEGSSHGLMSTNPGYPIVIKKKSAPWKSTSIYQIVSQNGGTFKSVPYNIYGQASLGKFRKEDNSDLIQGRSPLYKDVNHLRQVSNRLGDLIKVTNADLSEMMSKGSLLASAELQDFEKISLQRVFSAKSKFGVHFEDGMKRDDYPPLFKAIFKKVMGKYLSVAADIAKISSNNLRLLDYDPSDTSLGLYPNVPSEITHSGRVMLLRCIDPRGGPGDIFNQLKKVASNMGLDPALGYATKKAYRHRATKFSKFEDIVFFNGTEFVATHEGSCLVDPGRDVWMYNYAINYYLSPLYLFMKTSRSRIPGMFHTDIMFKQTIKGLQDLQSQGRVPVAVDQSKQDKHIGPFFFKLIADTLDELGIFPAESKIIRDLIHHTAVLIPHPNGPSSGTLMIEGITAMLSGMKLTSEIDTIQNLCTSLYSMEHVEPGITDKWVSGNYIYPAQGDDGLNMILKKDLNKYMDHSSHIEKELGVELKLFMDVLFLKRVLPLTPDITRTAKTMARVVLQSFFNEDNYDGIPGGVVPDCIFRIGLASRMEGLINNPYARKYWKPYWEVLCTLGYMERSSLDFRKSALMMKPIITEQDKSDLLDYAMRVPTYADTIVSRAAYDPGAALLLQFLTDAGINLAQAIPDHSQVRKVYESALQSQPTNADFSKLRANIGWLV